MSDEAVSLGVSRLYDHVCKVYDLMESRASVDRADNMVFVGKTTEVLADAGLTNNYYTPVFRVLKSAGCIIQVVRGGGGNNSVYHIVRRPTVDDFSSDVLKPATTKTKTALEQTSELVGKVAVLQNTVTEHTKIILKLQNIVLKMINERGGSINEEFGIEN